MRVDVGLQYARGLGERGREVGREIDRRGKERRGTG